MAEQVTEVGASSPRRAEYQRLRVSEERGVAFVTIDSPPLNHLDVQLARDLRDLARRLRRRRDLAVVVFQSDVPGFFIPHLDVTDLGSLVIPPEPLASIGLWTISLLARLGPPGVWIAERSIAMLSPFHSALQQIAALPQVTIAVVEGRIGGIGSELALCLDMRFGAPQATLNQLEAAVGGYPGAGGTQRLPLLIGEGPAMEIMASSADIDSATALRWGYYNRVLPSGEIREFVCDLAFRIAGFPGHGVRDMKQLVRRATRPDRKALQLEAVGFMRVINSPAGRARLQAFIDKGGQSPEGAADLARILGNDD